MQRLVFFILLLGSIAILALNTAAGAQRRPILPLPASCMSNTRATCEPPVTDTILICLVAEGPESDGCAGAGFIIEIARHSKAWPKTAIRPSVN